MIAFLFPGQGSQDAGMAVRAASPQFDRVLAEASTALSWDLEHRLSDPAFVETALGAQLGLLAVGVASARDLVDAGIRPDWVAGHSVGAFGAAVTAGVISLERAVRIVESRATLMSHAIRPGFGMAAVVGLEVAVVDEIAAGITGDDGPVYRANVNAPRQIVLSGERSALLRACDLALERGARTARLLNVAHPSHCALMEPVEVGLRAVFGDEPVAHPSVPFASNISGRLLRDGNAVRDDILANVAHPVRWDIAAQTLYEAGARLFVEMRPGRVLRDLMEQSFPDARAVSLDDGLADVEALFARMLRDA